MTGKFDLEDRLIEMAVKCIKLFANIKKSYALDHLSKQLIRSSTGAALNYGVAQGAESQKDFIHKMGLVLKECNELVAIFAKSIRTVKSKG